MFYFFLLLTVKCTSSFYTCMHLPDKLFDWSSNQDLKNRTSLASWGDTVELQSNDSLFRIFYLETTILLVKKFLPVGSLVATSCKLSRDCVFLSSYILVRGLGWCQVDLSPTLNLKNCIIFNIFSLSSYLWCLSLDFYCIRLNRRNQDRNEEFLSSGQCGTQPTSPIVIE